MLQCSLHNKTITNIHPDNKTASTVTSCSSVCPIIRVIFACHINFNIETFSFPLHWTPPPSLSSPEWTVDTPTHFTDGHAQLRTSAPERPMSGSQNRADMCSSPWHCHCATLPEPSMCEESFELVKFRFQKHWMHGMDKTFENTFARRYRLINHNKTNSV